MMTKVNYTHLIGVLFIFFIDSIPNYFYDYNERIDIWLFYDHLKHPDRILLDIVQIVRFMVLSWFLIKVNKNIFYPLFIISTLELPLYLLWYNQGVSIVLLPTYFISLYCFTPKERKALLFRNIRNIYNKTLNKLNTWTKI